MNKEESNQMFGLDNIDAWLDDICCSRTFALEGKAATAISLLSDVQELSFGNNGDMIRVAINRVKYLLDLDPSEELARRIVSKLMHHLEATGFEIVAVIDEEDRYDNSDPVIAMGNIFAIGEASLIVRKNDSPEHGILLIPGNEEDIISDWSYSTDDTDGFDKTMEAFTNPEPERQTGVLT